MPIYMDRHNVPGVSALHVAEAHREDLKIQEDYGCKSLTYWVDEERECVFCLIDAPDIESVKQMHNKAHGLIPHDIIEVNSNIVEAFLGRITDPDGYYKPDDLNLKIINDPAFRIVMVSQIANINLLKYRLGVEKANRLVNLYNSVFKEKIRDHGGSNIETANSGFISSFTSVSKAINAALAIQKQLHIAGEILGLGICINAGMPVENSKYLFGETITKASHLCSLGNYSQIVMASIVKDIYKRQNSKDPLCELKWVNSKDEYFVHKLYELLDDNFRDSQFDVSTLTDKLALSQSKLYRMSTSILGQSPNSLIRDFRLSRSLENLEKGQSSSEAAFDSGFNSPSYFSKCFQEKFSLLPLEYSKLCSK